MPLHVVQTKGWAEEASQGARMWRGIIHAHSTHRVATTYIICCYFDNI